MIYFEYIKKDGTCLISTLSDCEQAYLFNDRKEENIVIGDLRNAFQRTNFGSVRIIIVGEESDRQYTRSGKRTKTLMNIFVDAFHFFSRMEEMNQTQIKEAIELFAHNIINVHTHLKDKADRIFDEEVQRANNYKEQKDLVTKKISSDIDRAADDFCQISKRIDDLEAQLTVFKIITGIGKNIPVSYIRTNMKRVILRNMQPFFDVFRENGIEIFFLESEKEAEDVRIRIDPKSIMAALHLFFQNMTKYVMPGSRVCISQSLEENSLSVKFAMLSTRIEKDEIDLIFCRGYSGINVGNAAGQGIGMYVIKSALEKNEATLVIEPNYAMEKELGGVQFIENNFIFKFPINNKS